MSALSETISGTPTSPFQFAPVPQQFASLTGKEGDERLHRWGLQGLLKVQRFKFAGRFTAETETDFVSDFVTSDAFAAAMGLSSVVPTEHRGTKFEVSKLSSTVLNMGFFDAFETENLVAANGFLKKCMNDRVAGVDIDTLITDLLLSEDSEHAGAFSEAQKSEFIYHLFHLLFVGGAMHQRDESVVDYLETTKQLYKELVSVHKKSSTGKVEVTSRVLRVSSLAPSSTHLFAGVQEHGRCFVVVDPVKRLATAVYSDFKSFW